MPESRRPGLSRPTLIDAALRLLDEVGLDGLTVRRLAADLGVRSPALYWHIRTKQELLDGIADRIVSAAGMGPPRDGEGWADWLTRRAASYRRSLLAHRDSARIVATARSLGPDTVRDFDRELAAMVGIGFSPTLALRTISTLTFYANGFVQQEQLAAGHRTTAGPSAVPELDAGPSAPLLTAVAEGAGPLGEAAFAHGLRVLVDGTAVALAAESAEGS